jgi:peroxiredoxin Q/BCP
VSPDPPAKLGRWAAKKEFPYFLLGDEVHGTLERWGVWTNRTFMGRSFAGVTRSTFLVGPDGRIRMAWPKVNPLGHAKEVLAVVKGLKG